MVENVLAYYRRRESRVGYATLLGGTRHFGWYSPTDGRWQFSAALRRMEHQLGQRLALPSGSAVLDAGCGVGDVARALHDQFGLNVTGVDLLPESIGEARARGGAGGQFLQGSYMDLPFASESFDGVYTMETFVHAPDPGLVLSEFLRVLRPGGRLVMFEYVHGGQSAFTGRQWEAFCRVCELAAMPAWVELSHARLDELLHVSGLQVDYVEDVTERMLPMLSAFNLLARGPYWVASAVGAGSKVPNAMSAVEMWRCRGAWSYVIISASKPT